MKDSSIYELENINFNPSSQRDAPLLDSEVDISFELRQPFCMEKYHWHQQVEVNVIYRGNVEYIFNNSNVRIESGQMALFWAVTPHKVSKVSEDALMGIINIPLNVFLGWALPQKFIQQVTHGGVVTSGIDGIVSFAESKRWLNYYHEKNDIRNVIVQEEVFLMLRRLCSYNYQVEMFSFLQDVNMRNANYAGYKNVQLMLDFIANNHNTDIKVEDIAGYVKLHPKYAMSLFKNMLNVSIKQYLIIMRINNAKVLLSNTRNPVKNIATNSGFKHPSSFFAAFKTHMGITPQEYREQSQKIGLSNANL